MYGYWFSRSGWARPTTGAVASRGSASSRLRSNGTSTRTERLLRAGRSSGNSAWESRWERRLWKNVYHEICPVESGHGRPIAADARSLRGFSGRMVKSGSCFDAASYRTGAREAVVQGALRHETVEVRRAVAGLRDMSPGPGTCAPCRPPRPLRGMPAAVSIGSSPIHSPGFPPPGERRPPGVPGRRVSLSPASAGGPISRPGRASARRTSRACRSCRRSPWRRRRDRAWRSGSATCSRTRH